MAISLRIVEPFTGGSLVGEEEVGGTHAGLESGHVVVGPVRGFEVGGDPRIGGPKEVEKEEKVDGGEVVLAGGAGGVVGAFPDLC